MTKAIWKYPLLIEGGPQSFSVPCVSIVRAAAMQGRELCLWLEVDPTAEMSARLFEIFGTGHPIPADRGYVATVQDGSMVWHVYETFCT